MPIFFCDLEILLALLFEFAGFQERLEVALAETLAAVAGDELEEGVVLSTVSGKQVILERNLRAIFIRQLLLKHEICKFDSRCVDRSGLSRAGTEH